MVRREGCYTEGCGV